MMLYICIAQYTAAIGNYILRGGPIVLYPVVDLRVKNGVASAIFGHHMQKGSSIVHSPDYILYVVQ